MTGALRCKGCGADARAGEQRSGVSTSFGLDGGWMSPDVSRGLELIDELGQLAPAVLRWMQLDRATRGPRPDVRAADLDQVERILDEMRVVRAKLEARRKR